MPITLDYRDLRLGRSWILDGGHIQFTRNDDDMRLATGFSVLSGRDYVSQIEANYTSILGTPEARFGVTITDLPAEDIYGQSPAVGVVAGSENADLGRGAGQCGWFRGFRPCFRDAQSGGRGGATESRDTCHPVRFRAHLLHL